MVALKRRGGILALNGGSSSLKHAFFASNGEERRGEVSLATAGLATSSATRSPHATAVKEVLAQLRSAGERVEAVAHRVVHGGLGGSRPRRVDDALLASLRIAVPFAPLHLPSEIAIIEAVRDALPTTPQVACFDTDFHRAMPEIASRYPLPDELYVRGVRRYGFHGLSYEHVVASLGPRLGRRAVIAHLGSGASLAAVQNGVSIDTTMGFSPAGGLVMGTRTGDLDPGVLIHLLTHERYDAKSLDALVNRKGGLLALSGSTADMQELLAKRATDVRAALAVASFCRHVQKFVASMTASLGGLDHLVFTGGIGAFSPDIRAEICQGLAFLGVRLDESANRAGSASLACAASTCAISALITDEEAVLAGHARDVLAFA
jgi:acetate kinase